MIHGTGIDIVEVERIQKLLDRFGPRFMDRILRRSEIDYCMSFKHLAPQVAGRFAAKEAISKALGTGIGDRLGWRDMEIIRDHDGRPSVVLHGNGEIALEKQGGTVIHLSISHTRAYATAIAILQ